MRGSCTIVPIRQSHGKLQAGASPLGMSTEPRLHLLVSRKSVGGRRTGCDSVAHVTTPADVVVAEHEDTRNDGPMTGGERDVLDHWLDLYRETVFHKIAGLTAEQLRAWAERHGFGPHPDPDKPHWMRRPTLKELPL